MAEQLPTTKYNFIDLFAGCGGLSEGFYRQNFNALAHVEIDHTACKTLRTRMIHYGYTNANTTVIEHDITAPDVINCINEVIGSDQVDVIIGGPPCQAYSSLGRAKDENGMQDDPRNFLFESYAKILNFFKPKIFVFENVTGILTAKVNGKKIIELVLNALSSSYDVHLKVLNSVNYGVPQERCRVIIIGARKDLHLSGQKIHDLIKQTHYGPDETDNSMDNKKRFVTVQDAISELPPLKAGEGSSSQPFKFSLNNDFLKKIGSKSLPVLMDHVARNHNKTDIERYSEMAKHKWTFQELLANRPDLQHKKARVFGNSYVVQFWDKPSKTIIAHLYKDGNQFIHPDYKQGRTFTVREAARIQSFPDDFIFEGPRTEQYKQIGNAVPPLFAEAIAKAIRSALDNLKDLGEIKHV